MHLDLVTLLVDDYDPAITFFRDVLGFELREDSPSTTNDGRPKRWVVVGPPGGQTGLLLAKADGPHQRTGVGRQMFGRVGLFLRVEDFNTGSTLSPDVTDGGVNGHYYEIVTPSDSHVWWQLRQPDHAASGRGQLPHDRRPRRRGAFAPHAHQVPC